MSLINQLQNLLFSKTNLPGLEKALTSDFFQLNRTEAKFGDFSSNLPMRLTKLLKKAPAETAEILKAEWEQLPELEEVEFAPPGFINLTLSDEVKTKFLAGVFEEGFPALQSEKPRKILLEFVSANPTGPLHIGHGRWAVIGSVLAKVLEYNGHEVLREFYINDTGLQIQKLEESIAALKKGEHPPEDGYLGEYLHELVDKEDPKNEILEHQRKVLEKFQTFQDVFFSEKSLRDSGAVELAIKKLKESGYIYQADGATWFRSTDCGDDKDRVLVRSDGTYTYFAVDVAYHYDKIERGYPELIDILGADHHGYAKRIAGVVDILSNQKAKLELIIGQLVSLVRDGKPVRFSKRAGNIVELEEVIDEIGRDALRYFLSMRSFNSNLEFDLEVAKKQNMDNPIYYIQYAHARICSVLAKAEELGVKACFSSDFDFSKIKNPTANEIVKKMLEFNDEMKQVAVTYQIHHLNNYLYNLATLFHRFYNEVIFLPKDVKDRAEKITQAGHYLFFIQTVRKLMLRCFDLLSISAPEKM